MPMSNVGKNALLRQNRLKLLGLPGILFQVIFLWREMKKHIKIKTRLFIGFGVLIVLTISLDLNAFIFISTLSGDIQEMGNKRLPQALILGDLKENILTATAHLQKACIAENKEDIEKSIQDMLDTRKRIDDNFDKLRTLLISEKGGSIYQAMVDARKPTAATRDQVIKYLRDGNKKEAIQMLDKLEPLQAAYVKAVSDMDLYVKEKTKVMNETAESNLRTARIVIDGLGIAVLLFSILATFWIIGSINEIT